MVMLGGGGKSESESESGSQFDQEVWGGQAPYLTQLYQNLGNLFGSTLGGMEGQIPGAVDWMKNIQQGALPGWQDQMEGGAYKDMDLQNRYLRSYDEIMGNPSETANQYAQIMGGEGNNYADAMRDQYVQDATRAQENMLRNMDARAAASGMSGGSRHGVATAQGMEDINKNLQGNMAKLGYETFDKDLQNKLNIASMADQNRMGALNSMGNMIGNQQQAMSGGLQYAPNMQQLGMGTFQPYMAPWQTVPTYANAIGRPTILSSGNMFGSSSGSSKGASMGGK